MEDVRAWLALTLVPGVSLDAQHRLIESLGSAGAIANADPQVIESIIGAPAAQALAKGPDPSLVDRTLAWLRDARHRLVVMGSREYPGALVNVHRAPAALYVQGRVELLNTSAFTPKLLLPP